MENSPVKTEIVWVEEECHEIMLPLKQEDCKLEEKGLDGERESPTYTEVPPSPHGCHEIMLPLKQEDCKLEETPASVDYIQSSEEGGGEDIHKSEEMQFATVKCEKDSEDEIDEAADLDVKEDILIIEDENPLPSSSEEAGRLSSSAPEIQSEEIVPQTFYTRIGESYYCARCDTPFRRQSDFNSHVAKCHKQINRFQCPNIQESSLIHVQFARSNSPVMRIASDTWKLIPEINHTPVLCAESNLAAWFIWKGMF
ncbi:uncharacterized protein [Anabrus simplex]|uniref:uncharacterized protein n=1 Tax=Anabrus simplex TaxID=316456 RepID=UPI0035A2F2D9